MATDLTDVQAAKLLGKDPRTIQRWCAQGPSGKLPDAYKAGRSWRIPRGAVIAAGLGAALRGDDYVGELRVAVGACALIRAEIESLNVNEEPLVRRDWRVLSRELQRLEAALSGLSELAGKVPEALLPERARAQPGASRKHEAAARPRRVSRRRPSGA